MRYALAIGVGLAMGMAVGARGEGVETETKNLSVVAPIVSLAGSVELHALVEIGRNLLCVRPLVIELEPLDSTLTTTFGAGPTDFTVDIGGDSIPAQAGGGEEGMWDWVGRLVDYSPAAPATFQAEILRVMGPEWQFQPFAAVAREGRAFEDARTGLGAGTRWKISPRVNFGTEVFVFPVDRWGDMDRMSKVGDMQMMTRIEVRF